MYYEHDYLFIHAEPSPCSPEYFNVATQEKCEASWDKLAAAQECKYVQKKQKFNLILVHSYFAFVFK